MSFLKDPSFWVSAAFFGFFLCSFNFIFRNVRRHLNLYCSHVQNDLEIAKECVEEAEIALKNAIEGSKKNTLYLRDLQRNTDHQIQLVQAELLQEIKQAKERSKQAQSIRWTLVERQLKQEIRKALTDGTIDHVYAHLSRCPLGLSPSFQKAVTKYQEEGLMRSL